MYIIPTDREFLSPITVQLRYEPSSICSSQQQNEDFDKGKRENFIQEA